MQTALIKECVNVKLKKKQAKTAACLAGLLFVLLFAVSVNSRNEESLRMGAVIREYISGQVEKHLLDGFVPVFAFVEEENRERGQELVKRQMDQIMPLYGYWNDSLEETVRVEDRMTIEMILLAEAEEGSQDDTDSASPNGQGAGNGSGTQGSEHDNKPGNEQGDVPVTENGGDMQGLNNGGELQAQEPGQGAVEEGISGLEELFRAENEAAGGIDTAAQEVSGLAGEFIPHQKLAEVDLSQYTEYESLVKNFYTIDKTTMIGSDQLNIDSLAGKDMTISKDSQGPQILIYHTHSQEAFADSVPGDASTTILGVGERLTQILTEKYGYTVLHHTGQYDVESRDDAYSAALPAIEQVLAENPGIQVVIDLHRDAMAEETHLVMDLDGRPTARFMFFNGLSRTRKTGNISYLYNENQDSNLAFSFQMQKKAMEYYPGLTRKIYLKGYRYNMHLRPRTLLIELGAQNNTVEEAMNACDPLAHILDMVLSGQE